MPSFTSVSSTDTGAWLHRQWRGYGLWPVLALPFSLLFAFLVIVRRWFYRAGLLQSFRLPVPVIVVGNLTVGGSGKTPLVLWLCQYLRSRGYRPGIISRGYGSRARHPQSVSATSDPALAGDEPVLLARRAQCPVWVGVDRVAVARGLLSARPDCDILISDDGLQHYRLERDVEIVVVDGQRRFGNGWMLPAGPMREPAARLESASAVVINSGDIAPGEYAMRLSGGVFANLHDRSRTVTAHDLAGRRLHAIAGIGYPARFFGHLRRLGLDVIEHPFPDHHNFRPEELQFEGADAILMTEKDAVKCTGFAPGNSWVLAVDADIDAAFGNRILELLALTRPKEK